ncbi:MAG: DnaJ domain-containing protein [Treponema sp.]|nr:DnaJ domain-containing protein [Treponema sp.]
MAHKLKTHYELLGVELGATAGEIKKAFREKAKRLHPDIAGSAAAEAMRKLICAYEVLSSPQRRFEYDRAYSRFVKKTGFNYRTWLREQDNPASQAKLVFFELLHLEEDEAIALWRKNGGLDFPMNKHLDREDWMDCLFILAEELDRRGSTYEAFRLFAAILREERRRPYFRHFTQELEKQIKTIVRLKLKPQVDNETWIECMEIMTGLDFSARDQNRWIRSMADTLKKMRQG